MFCSISTRKSNPKWLDRLRSSKGFDLDHFEAVQNKPTNLSSQQTNPLAQFTSEAPAPSPQNPPFLGDVLAELFAFGPETSNLPSKKKPRKIPNPKSLKVSSFNNGDLCLRVLQSGDDRRGGGGGEEVVVSKKGFLGEEEEKMDSSLSGFSRTEVTVIDTSCKGWKFDKVLFRKKSVWKVRDRKSKGVSFESNDKKKMKMKMKKKKRKLSAEEEEEEEEVGVRKKKKKMVFGQCSSSKEGKRGEFSIRISDEGI